MSGSLGEQVKEQRRKKRGFFAYISTFGLLVNKQIFEVSLII